MCLNCGAPEYATTESMEGSTMESVEADVLDDHRTRAGRSLGGQAEKEIRDEYNKRHLGEFSVSLSESVPYVNPTRFPKVEEMDDKAWPFFSDGRLYAY